MQQEGRKLSLRDRMSSGDADEDVTCDEASGASPRQHLHSGHTDDEFTPPNSKEKALEFDSEHLLRTENIPFDVREDIVVTFRSERVSVDSS